MADYSKIIHVLCAIKPSGLTQRRLHIPGQGNHQFFREVGTPRGPIYFSLLIIEWHPFEKKVNKK